MRRFPASRSRFRGVGLKAPPRPARRLVRQQSQERPLRRPQQERTREPQQQHRISGRPFHAFHDAGNVWRDLVFEARSFPAEVKNGGAQALAALDTPSGRAKILRPVPWVLGTPGRGSFAPCSIA